MTGSTTELLPPEIAPTVCAQAHFNGWSTAGAALCTTFGLWDSQRFSRHSAVQQWSFHLLALSLLFTRVRLASWTGIMGMPTLPISSSASLTQAVELCSACFILEPYQEDSGPQHSILDRAQHGQHKRHEVKVCSEHLKILRFYPPPASSIV